MGPIEHDPTAAVSKILSCRVVGWYTDLMDMLASSELDNWVLR